jgi:phospholipid/cholesterol/gamma-HCH transport system substrate-binding protein
MNRTDDVKAGAFLIVGLALFVFTLFILGKERQLFSRQEEYHTTFTDVKGLSEGAPVRLGGISVGRVSEIGFSEDHKDTAVHVKFLVNSAYLNRVRNDSMVAIETQGLLGDRFLSINPGKGENTMLPGSFVKSSEPTDIAQVLNKAGTVVDNTVQISNNINEFVETFKKETLSDIKKTTKSVADIAQEIETGDGLLHRLVYSKKDGDSIIQGISQTSKDISAIVGEIKSGKGFLNALIYDAEGSSTLTNISKAAQGISNLADSVTQITNTIQSGKGLIHQLIYEESPDGLDQVVNKLNETANNLRKASESLAQGTGTLGALLVDSQLYDNLVEVTDGAKRSFLLRQAIRTALDK